MESTNEATSQTRAEHEKNSAALSSVVAAVFLTSIKIIVGLLTGSLGILSEAAHSGLDLVAAAVTFFAVRLSGKPADPEHTYGHGKIENLSALFETVLLLVTCVWIIYEAIQRLFFKSVQVEASIWAFIIMGASIVVDFTRSRLLARVAKKYGSQALEADALHFSTDIWSSSVVIVGLFLVLIAERFNIPWLFKADAVAAMGVAGIVVYVSLQLGKKTVDDLLDSIPPGKREELVRAVKVPGVVEVRRVRVRRSGPEVFADVRIAVSPKTSFERTQIIADQVEAAAKSVLPNADVVVQIEPGSARDQGIFDLVRQAAARHEMSAHSIRVYGDSGKRSIELHLEVNEGLELKDAHALATAFEEELRKLLPDVERLVTHLEPGGDVTATTAASAEEEAQVMEVLRAMQQETGISCQPHDFQLQRLGDHFILSFHCTTDGGMNIGQAHLMSQQVEHYLRQRLPSLGRIVVHVEPLPEQTA